MKMVATGLLAASLYAQPAQMAEPDAQRTKDEFQRLLERYQPTLRGVFALDPSLLTNQPYMAPYPALVSFLGSHPEIARNPAYYVGGYNDRNNRFDRASQAMDMWREVLNGIAVFAALGMAIGLITWLIRTLVDYRRWQRLSKVQTEVHTKLLDRFTSNEDLLAYVQSHAGKRFLESSPILLDEGPRAVGAPLGRILWSVQGGLVMMAAGVGLEVAGGRLEVATGQVSPEAAQPLHVLGILGIAIGLGLAASAIISFVISWRLGLIEKTQPPRAEAPGVQG